MKVVSMKNLRRGRTPYERNPYCPIYEDNIVDVSPWRLRLPIPRSQSSAPVALPSWEWSVNDRPERRLLVTSSAPAGTESPDAVDRLSQTPSPSWHISGSRRSVAEEQPSSPALLSAILPDAASLLVTKSHHKLRKHNKEMICFRSQGAHDIAAPPFLSSAREYDVYLHQYANGTHVWYASSNGSWTIASEGMKHPQYPDYVLHVSSDQWARWLLKKTINTYQGRERRLLHRNASEIRA
ncbi:hypothetical protein PENSPDRAFT_693826 [Peniophora sp. CONT]|nr:hypothetical protein PENSPDRAFT_693826 [Peniophora sp. CONT]